MSVTYPRGFLASGVTAGFKPSGLADLGMLVGEAGTTAAALFTTNPVAAAPVAVGRERVGAGSPRAVLVNSGQANAATGDRGIADATTVASSRRSCSARAGRGAAVFDRCDRRAPAHGADDAGVARCRQTLSRDGGEAFARAIMTTDTVHKQACADGAGSGSAGARRASA